MVGASDASFKVARQLVRPIYRFIFGFGQFQKPPVGASGEIALLEELLYEWLPSSRCEMPLAVALDDKVAEMKGIDETLRFRLTEGDPEQVLSERIRKALGSCKHQEAFGGIASHEKGR